MLIDCCDSLNSSCARGFTREGSSLPERTNGGFLQAIAEKRAVTTGRRFGANCSTSHFIVNKGSREGIDAVVLLSSDPSQRHKRTA